MMDGFLGWAAVLICVCGASTFLADHAGNRFRFLTEKGVSPTSVWLSRQLVWLFLALPIGVAAITLAATSHDAANVRSQERLDLLTRQGNWSWWAVLLITSFTVGEFCSPLLRNGIIAWSASIAGVCLFSFWWMLMFVLGVPIWSVAVVPAILLLGSWRNASYMLVDNPGWRSQLGSLLWTIIPGAILVSSIIGYRSWQIPDIDPGFRVEDSRRPLTDAEQQLQTEFFAKVAHLRFRVAPGEENPGSLSPEELKWLGENQELLKLAEKMGKQRTTLVFDPSRAKTFVESARLLPNVLGFDARRLLGEGKIQESFERTVESLAVCRLVTFGHYMEPAILTWLPTWAAAPNQTPDIITDARKRLSEFFTDAAASSDDIRWQHVWMEYALAQKDPYGGASTTDQQMFQKIWQLLSWERTRSRRLLNQMSHGLLANLDHVEASLRRGVPFHELALIDNPRIGEWQRSTIPWFQDQYHQELASQSHSRYTMEATRRVTDLHLALQTWKLTHHGLPRTLEEMVGTCLDKIPLDPYSNQPIAYFPDGWPEQLVHKHVAIPLGSGPIIPASTPFVWIAGPNTINTSSRPMQLPLKYDGGRIQVFRSASSKQEWLEFGMIFRIPERL